DVLTRAVAQRLSEMWKQRVIVENRGGAASSFAAQSVMRAEHDGHTARFGDRLLHDPTASLCQGQTGLRCGEGLHSGCRLLHHSNSAACESIGTGEFGQ